MQEKNKCNIYYVTKKKIDKILKFLHYWKYWKFIVMFLLGGGKESGTEAEGRTEHTHRDAGLGGGRGGYAILSFTLLIKWFTFKPVTYTRTPAVTVRWLPRRHVIISSQLYTPVGQQLNQAAHNFDRNRNDSAEPYDLSQRRTRCHPLG